MKWETIQFLADMAEDRSGRWITFTGPSGVGKTTIARLIFREWKALREQCLCPELGITKVRLARFWDWRKKAKQMADFDMTGFGAATECDLLVIDDIGAEHDPSGFILSKLDILLNSRLGKWTVLTTNLPLREIADKLDARISSRMLRGGGVVIEVPQDTEDFSI